MDRVSLGSRVHNTPRPIFLGTVGDQTITVALDNSAVSALAPDTSGDDLDAQLDLRRGMISQTAQRLYSQGFYEVTETGIELVISALDLEPS